MCLTHLCKTSPAKTLARSIFLSRSAGSSSYIPPDTVRETLRTPDERSSNPTRCIVAPCLTAAGVRFSHTDRTVEEARAKYHRTRRPSQKYLRNLFSPKTHGQSRTVN